MNIITVYLEQSDLDHLLYTPFPSKSKSVCARARVLNSQALPAYLGTTCELHNLSFPLFTFLAMGWGWNRGGTRTVGNRGSLGNLRAPDSGVSFLPNQIRTALYNSVRSVGFGNTPPPSFNNRSLLLERNIVARFPQQ